MKVVNKDAAMTALRCKLREAREQKNRSQDVAEGISCGECFFYDRTAKRCIHKNGLGGRVRPGMYCSYGSYHHEAEPEDEDDFSELEEEDDASSDD